MRLIDADALRYEIAKYFDGLPIQGHYDMLKMVDEAPTIEAEPTIEQINNYCETRNLTILTNDLFYHLQKQSNCKVKEGEDE